MVPGEFRTMARRAESSFWIVKSVNDLLFSAWEHGARHLALHDRKKGIEMRFLSADGCEFAEFSPLPYKLAVRRLQQMSNHHGPVRVNAAGQHWRFNVDFPHPQPREGIFLHLRPTED